MANADVAPKKGRRTKAVVEAENSSLTEEVKELKAKNGLTWFFVILFLGLAVVVGGIYAIVNHQREDRVVRPESTVTPVAASEPASLEERGIGVPVGSWGEVLALKSDSDTWGRYDAMNTAMAEYRGFAIPEAALRDHVSEEIATGEPNRFVWTADRPLAGWLNTNWDSMPPRIFGDNFAVGDQFLVMEADVLAKYGVDISVIPTEAKVQLNGKVCVILARNVCTNHVWPVRNLIVRWSLDKEGVKGPNPYPGFVGEHQASAGNPGSTPRYSPPGKAETIVRQQEKDTGSTAPTQYGAPDVPEAVTIEPDGTAVVTPPPTTEPDPPPPLPEIPAGEIPEPN